MNKGDYRDMLKYKDMEPEEQEALELELKSNITNSRRQLSLLRTARGENLKFIMVVPQDIYDFLDAESKRRNISMAEVAREGIYLLMNRTKNGR